MTAGPNGAAVGQNAPPKSGGRETYELSQFLPVGELGMGAFGVVKQVKHKDTNQTFAMKVMEKSTVVKRGLQEQLRREVLHHSALQHPHVIRLHYHFEDKVRIYCLLEYADKGQLFSYLRDQVGGLPELRAGLFFSGTTRGLQYLHGLSIAHRDIKPENILLFGEDLTAKIGDFGWCVKLTPEVPERTTWCGTLDYMPPEMLFSEPHNIAVDLWALGVLLYEMLVARAPFAADSQKMACDLISAVKFEIPKGSMSEGAEQVIRGLLRRNPNDRWLTGPLLSNPWVAKHGQLPPNNDPLEATIVVPRSAFAVDSAKPPLVASSAMTAASKASAKETPDKANQESADSLDATIIMPRRQAPVSPTAAPPPKGEGPVAAPMPAPKNDNARMPVANRDAPVTSQKAELSDRRRQPDDSESKPFLLSTTLQSDQFPKQPENPCRTAESVRSNALPTFAGYQHNMPQGAPTADFGSAMSSDFLDVDLLSSVPDARVELGDLANLFIGSETSATAIEHSYVAKQAAKEFGRDGARRRTALDNDKAAATAWRAPAAGGLPALEADAPRAKRLSRRSK